MRPLPLRIGVGNQRAGFAQSKTSLPEQALALADLEALIEPSAQGFPILQRAGQTEVARGLVQDPVDLPELRFAQTPRASPTLARGQPRETLGFKTPHPILDAARSVTQPAPHFRTSRSLGHQEDTMETVIIARFFRTANLVLQSQNSCSGVIDLQWPHVHMTPQILAMRNYL
jgi:hypothetical protein